MKKLAALGVMLVLLLCGCRYSPPKWQSRIENGVSDASGNVTALAMHSTLYRWPQGFIAQFPDGGKAKLLRDEATIYVLDRERAAIVRILKIPRPDEVHSQFAPWVIELDANCVLLYKLTGRRGETSDTEFVMRTYEVNACNPAAQPKQVERTAVQAPLGKSVGYTNTEVSMTTATGELRWRISPSGELQPE